MGGQGRERLPLVVGGRPGRWGPSSFTISEKMLSKESLKLQEGKHHWELEEVSKKRTPHRGIAQNKRRSKTRGSTAKESGISIPGALLSEEGPPSTLQAAWSRAGSQRSAGNGPNDPVSELS